MGIGFTELLVILVVVLILFGAGKLPGVMSEMGKGVKNFKSGLKDDAPADAVLPTVTAQTPSPVLPVVETPVMPAAGQMPSHETSRDGNSA